MQLVSSVDQFDSILRLYITGNNRPTLKLLDKLVKPHVTKWYDLGIELLEVEDLKTLDKIRIDCPRDADACCTRMFQLWLDRQPEASWRQLIQALRELKMNELAGTIVLNLSNEGKLFNIDIGKH